MGDESPYAHESKSMIGFVPSAQQPTLQSSKVQNCQHWGQLLGGSPSTFLIALGEIISIFIYIFGFHWKILPILMFGIHSGLSYFCQKFQWNPKIYIKIERISPRAIKKVDGHPFKSWPQCWQFWTLDDCNVDCWVSWSNLMMNNCCYGSYASFPTLKNEIWDQPFFRFGNSCALTV